MILCHPSNKRKGFTLVELSIVIVIISLIIAGVSAGQSLVKAAQLRSVITDVQSFQASVNAFKLQYNAQPGDIANASSYWTCPNNGGNNLNCNGNGNRKIEWAVGGNGGGGNNSESYRFWQHLQLAGLLTNYSVSGVNQPGSRIKNSLYSVQYQPVNYFGRPNTGLMLTDPTMWTGILTPIDVQSIDSKMDDGVANTGKMYGESSNCSANFTSAGADYNLSLPGPCVMVWFIF